jgi:hypothetical protein
MKTLVFLVISSILLGAAMLLRRLARKSPNADLLLDALRAGNIIPDGTSDGPS